MKAEELINIFKKYPDFKVVFHFIEADNSEWGITLRRFIDLNITDVGFSDKIIVLGGRED